jgi:2-C-methyl-D-erythritol 4-phosphate cytidylyltransferase
MVVVKAVIVAGGSSSRMEGVDKIFATIAGKPVIAYTIDAFERCGAISGIVLVLLKASLGKGKALVEKYGYKKVEKVCEGGKTRRQSVYNGLKAVGECDFVEVHDGARPCVSTAAIEKGIEEAMRNGIAIAASPVHDTIKHVDHKSMVKQTMNRDELRVIHTPQVFRSDIIRKIYEDPAIEATDDAGLAERLGYPVKVYDDAKENIKITTTGDLAFAETILLKRASLAKLTFPQTLQ